MKMGYHTHKRGGGAHIHNAENTKINKLKNIYFTTEENN